MPARESMEMTIVHRESQLSKNEEKKNGGTTYVRDQARQLERQYHQDRKHHNLNE